MRGAGRPSCGGRCVGLSRRIGRRPTLIGSRHGGGPVLGRPEHRVSVPDDASSRRSEQGQGGCPVRSLADPSCHEYRRAAKHGLTRRSLLASPSPVGLFPLREPLRYRHAPFCPSIACASLSTTAPPTVRRRDSAWCRELSPGVAQRPAPAVGCRRAASECGLPSGLRLRGLIPRDCSPADRGALAGRDPTGCAHRMRRGDHPMRRGPGWIGGSAVSDTRHRIGTPRRSCDANVRPIDSLRLWPP